MLLFSKLFHQSHCKYLKIPVNFLSKMGQIKVSLQPNPVFIFWFFHKNKKPNKISESNQVAFIQHIFLYFCSIGLKIASRRFYVVNPYDDLSGSRSWNIISGSLKIYSFLLHFCGEKSILIDPRARWGKWVYTKIYAVFSANYFVFKFNNSSCEILKRSIKSIIVSLLRD